LERRGAKVAHRKARKNTSKNIFKSRTQRETFINALRSFGVIEVELDGWREFVVGGEAAKVAVPSRIVLAV
jgi:hypothetical protein